MIRSYLLLFALSVKYRCLLLVKVVPGLPRM